MDTISAKYQAWSQTWEALARQSPLAPIQLERRLVRFFHGLSRELDPSVVLEIGAHGARYSRWVSEALPRARVLAFEANPYVHEKFASQLADTGIDYRNLAVGDVTGEITLNLPVQTGRRKRSLTSPMASLRVHTRSVGNIEVTVPCVRLDEHVDLRRSDSVVAWIDVEGANEAVLTGCSSLLDRVNAIFIEVENETTWEGQWLDTDVNRYLDERGFVPMGRDVVRRRPHQYNVVFVRSTFATRKQVARLAARVLKVPRRPAQASKQPSRRRRERS